MRINARSRLWGQLRAFVETELRGLATWDQVEHIEPERAPEVPVQSVGGVFFRRNPLGDYKEIAAIRFGEYEILIKSSEESPPLGLVELRNGGVIDSGPIDQSTWQRLGKTIRDQEAQCHGR